MWRYVCLSVRKTVYSCKQGEDQRDRDKRTLHWAWSFLWGSVPGPWAWPELTLSQSPNQLSLPGTPRMGRFFGEDVKFILGMSSQISTFKPYWPLVPPTSQHLSCFWSFPFRQLFSASDALLSLLTAAFYLAAFSFRFQFKLLLVVETLPDPI